MRPAARIPPRVAHHSAPYPHLLFGKAYLYSYERPTIGPVATPVQDIRFCTSADGTRIAYELDVMGNRVEEKTYDPQGVMAIGRVLG